MDATARLLLEEGYGAVSARRVAAEAGVTLGLVHYYFATMEALLVEVFRRRAEWMLDREAEALACDQPLWALWDVTREYANTPLNQEFLALGNHYATIHAEVCAYSERFRQLQHELVSKSRLPSKGARLPALRTRAHPHRQWRRLPHGALLRPRARRLPEPARRRPARPDGHARRHT